MQIALREGDFDPGGMELIDNSYADLAADLEPDHDILNPDS